MRIPVVEKALNSAAKVISEWSPDTKVFFSGGSVIAERLNFSPCLILLFSRDNYFYGIDDTKLLDKHSRVRLNMHEQHTAGAYEPARERSKTKQITIYFLEFWFTSGASVA